MLSDIVFFVSAALAVCSAFFIFKAREMAHAMVGFLGLSIAAAFVLALLNLPLLALLQLFIMVGGVSTYLFVGVSSENLSRFKHTSFPVLVALSVALAVVPIYKILSAYTLELQVNTLTPSVISSSLSSNLPLFYMLALLLFGIGISSILMMRSFRKGGRK
jgi:NADH:ubiquinone oxidoreductase subunit 6 (subunit J)